MGDYDLIVRGGTVVTGRGVFESDLCVREGRIVALTSDPGASADQVVEAGGKLVFPGIIDAHVHMQIMQQDKYPTADDFESGTAAALAGGVTTIIDFVEPAEEGGQTLWEAQEARRALADPQVRIDYGLHAVPTRDTDLEAEIDALIEEAGITSFKLFQVYGRLALSDAELYATLDLLASKGALATLHAENGQVADLLTGRLRSSGRKAAIDHAYSRPPFVEATCIQTAINFTREVDGNLYIVHLSTAQGLEAIRRAQDQGLRVLAETCPQYLVLDESRLAGPEGNLYLCTPPLRPPHHQVRLWQGLSAGTVQTGATDHCSFMREQKLAAPAFYQAPGGLGSVELLLPILHSEGVRKGRFSLEHLARVLCHNPARIFGLAPRKGYLHPGSDADMVIFDPEPTWTVTSEALHGKDDYSAYEELELRGRVEATLARGEILYRNGQVLGEPGRGRYLKRELPSREALHDVIGNASVLG